MYNKTYERKIYSMENIVLTIFSILFVLIIIWFTYTIANIIVTILKCKKLDKSLHFCFNAQGKIFYSILTLIYVLGVIGGIVGIVYGLLNNKLNIYQIGLNSVALSSVVFAYFLSSLVLIGRKNMMVGRMMIDYRKLKKVSFNFNKQMSFVYAQKDYHFSTRFVDVTELRKIIAR